MNILGILSKGDDFGDRSTKPIIPGANLTPPIEPNQDHTITKDQVIPTFQLQVNPALTQHTKIPIVIETDKEKPPLQKKIRVLFCGTYPVGQSNGYSRVVYYIAKHIGAVKDIDLTIYGFQNFRQATTHTRTDIPPSVKLHDAYATEEPKRNGFGEQEISDFIRKNPQDIVVIFNDSVVTTMLVKDIIEKLSEQERNQFKLISYMDQVYPYQRKEYIETLNKYFDAIITFTPYWKEVAYSIGIRKELPIYFFPHGFDSKLYFPIARKVARLFYQLPEDDFIILNLNRNQPRKRWDHTIMAYADVVQRHMELKNKSSKPIRGMKLMIGTAIQGFWDLLELFEIEMKKRGYSLDEVRDYLTTIAKPQQMSDRDINIMYNSCDIGLNTCEGEGFGLCQFEHLAVGCPQVTANIGGFREFLHTDNSIVLEPKWFYYVDKLRDGIGGYAEVSDPKNIADAIWKYYQNPKLVLKHGLRGRQEILQHYSWETMISIFDKILHKIYNASINTPASL
uniref:Glycosyl transferase family 1 domain-containing protein n=1 Tax=viral metagenome TaxID=1070528 RepID=A0A6C0CRT1_9ZZZZ